MEPWITVAVALIVALSTLGATFIQNRYSAKQLARQLESEKEKYFQERRREVRGEPLLKLRAELARMATMANKLVDTAHRMHNETGTVVEQEKNKQELEKAVNEWNTYLASGNLLQSKFMQYDAELFNRISQILEEYIAAYYAIETYTTKPAESANGAKESKKIWNKVIELQELINKRLEEL